jgi:hypothetical protein
VRRELRHDAWPFVRWMRALVVRSPLVVESRGPRGEAQKSHWTTVMAITSPRPIALKVMAYRVWGVAGASP